VIEISPELVARCQRGDARSFAQLVAETQNDLYNLSYNILHSHEEAEDMAQEIYMRVWRALPTFRGDSKFGTWLYRIGVNACLNRRRQLRTQLYIADGDDALESQIAADDDPATSALASERNRALWAAVDRLPEKYRLMITLFYQQQLSYDEIASMLSLPLGTVKAHLNRARQALAASLRPRQE